MTNLNEKISSLSSYTYKHDVLFNKYQSIELYKITDNLLNSAEGSSFNNLLTLYDPVNTANDDIENFKTRLTHQPKIYSITKARYSDDPINKDYFTDIENWLNENSDSRENDLKNFFSYRGNETNIDNGVIQNCIFDDSEERYNLAPIKITAIKTLDNKNNLPNINVNTISTIYKYLLRINDASGNLKTMLDSLKEKITSLSDGLTQESNTSHIEKSLMNQATFKIVAKNGENLKKALDVIDKSGQKNFINSWYDGGILYAHKNSNGNVDRIYFTNNCNVRYGGISGNGITKLDNGARILSYYHHGQKYFYYEDINKVSGKLKASLPMCKIYLNLDTCMSGPNSFGIGYTTTDATEFYFMVTIKKGFRNEIKNLTDDTYSIKNCLDGNWLDICQFIGKNKRKFTQNNNSWYLSIGKFFGIALYGNDNEFITQSGNDGWCLNPECNSNNGQNISGATEFRLAQYYNSGNILGFFAETDENNSENKYHPLAIYRSDMELPVLMKKQYIRQSGNGKHIWYFSVGDNSGNLDKFIEYIGFKVIVPKGGYFKIMHSETFYEGNMINENGELIAPTNFTNHSVIPLGRSGVYKTS